MRNPRFASYLQNNESVYSRIGFYMVRLEEKDLLMGVIHDEEDVDEALNIMRCWYSEMNEDKTNGTPLLRTYEVEIFNDFLGAFDLNLADVVELEDEEWMDAVRRHNQGCSKVANMCYDNVNSQCIVAMIEGNVLTGHKLCECLKKENVDAAVDDEFGYVYIGGRIYK